MFLGFQSANEISHHNDTTGLLKFIRLDSDI